MLHAFIPVDRSRALAHKTLLPDRTSGAALLADISGFTPLTEALLKVYGRRVGPEELTRQLNLIFEALIAQVHRYGGSVISFSGDALTCWFDGDDGWRAATCALDMQTAISRLATSELIGPLAIKVAVAAGPARRFVVGDPDIQLIDTLAGATLTRMAAAEKLAAKGEVIVGPEIKPRLGAAAQTLERPAPAISSTFYLLTDWCERAAEAPWPDASTLELSDEQVRPWLLNPIATQLLNGSPRFLAESRAAVALFLKFGELDYDADDAAGEKLDAFIRWTQNVLDQHGGHLIQLTIGDKASYLYATFGALIAHDDDAQRALAAARWLISPPADVSPISQVQIGLSQGRMFAGIYGSATRCTFGVLGDDVNLAARLMTLAQPGHILVSKRLFESAMGSHHFQSLGQIQIKGKAAWQPVYRVTDEQTAPAVSKQSTPLIGREHELEQIDRLLQAVQAGQGHTLRISGAAGIGKSRLKNALIDRAAAHGLLVAHGVCHSSTQQTSYYPWRQILKALFNAGPDLSVAQLEHRIAELDERWRDRLPLLSELLGLAIPETATTRTLEAHQRQTMLADFVLDLLRVWADRQPRVIVLEDVQWLDEASQPLTLAVARAAADKALLLVVVHRDDRAVLAELDQAAYHQTIDLDCLSAGALRVIVGQRLQGEVDPLVIELIQRRAQGNPLFIEQLVEALIDSAQLVRAEEGRWSLADAIFNTLLSAGCVEKREGEWTLSETAALSAADLDLPDTLQALVQSRLDRLSPDHKLTLKVASVIGEEFDLDLLARAHPERASRSQWKEQLQLLEAHAMLQTTAPTKYVFTHPVLQEVTYASVPEEQRRALHGAVGAVIEDLQPGRIEQLAYHFDRSDFDEKAVYYLDKAARSAQLKGINRTALTYYTRALRRVDNGEWRKGKVEAWHSLGERTEELLELRALEAAALLSPAETARLWSDYYEATADYAQARTFIERALIEYDQRSDVLGQARGLNQLGAIAARQGDFDRARDSYHQALNVLMVKEERSIEEALVLIRTLNGLGIAACQQGQYEDSRTYFEQALESSRTQGNRLDEAQALNNLGMLAAYQRDFDRAQQYHREALEMRRAIGYRAGEGASLANLAQVLRDQGDYGQAIRHLADALAIRQSIGDRWGEANVLNDQGILHLLLGNLAMAQVCLERGWQVMCDIGDESGQAYILCNMGQVMRDTGDLASAEKWLTRSLALAQQVNDKHLESLCLSHLGQVNLKAGRLAQAIEQATTALTLREELGLTLWKTADLTTIASAYLIMNDLAAALRYAVQAISILEESGEEGEFPHRDYFVCYQVFLAAGQTERAWAALQSAHRLVVGIRDQLTKAEMRASFLAIPVNGEIVGEFNRHAMQRLSGFTSLAPIDLPQPFRTNGR